LVATALTAARENGNDTIIAGDGDNFIEAGAGNDTGHTRQR